MHAGCTYAADLFLVHQNTAGSAVHLQSVQHGEQGCKSAHPVVLSVGKDHAAVYTAFPGPPCRHDLQLRGEKIFLFHVVILLKKRQGVGFHRFFLFFIKVFGLLNGAAAKEQVQLLALDHCICLLLHLLSGQVDQKIRDHEDRIFLLLPDGDLLGCAVLSHHHAVDRQGKGYPLVLLDPSVIVGVQVGQLFIFIERILFHIDTR